MEISLANKYKSGNTVRLIGEFYDFEGNLIDPQIVKVAIYDYKHNLIQEVVVGQSSKLSKGIYYFDYVTKNGNNKIIYEWYGEIDGRPSLDRNMFVTDFM
jgi:hypothetical protein